MALSYNKLWKLLIDKKMKKKDLINLAEISTSTLAKMSKDKQVSMDVISRICISLECNIGDIMDILPDENTKSAL
ncbi:helix-turn-helix transcriptional regulator [Clostridium sp. JS66]|uniref:helix-turn-helix domain-containing protein n=1 Tax=Clostridium sp. JS66 TaxID=3064705 RepID=UPI00298E158B|nr:helix-turn-helix transcriptional regulator [Clostridium sp. JS66]WPC40067.1 helix-turn-helix transcriptional regulator [Clostridium sp. JS66]